MTPTVRPALRLVRLLAGATTVVIMTVLSACTDTTSGTPRPGSTASAGAASDGAPDGLADVLTVPRPGYRDLPGDPAAVVAGPPGPVVRYGGVPVVPACNLITPQDIRAAGGFLWPTSLASAITRTTIDDEGAAGLTVPRTILPSYTEECSYTLEPDTDRGWVKIAVYQPTYADPEAITTRTRGLTPAPSIGATTVYERTRTEPYTHDWALTYGDVLAELSVRDRRETLPRPLLTVAAQRLVELVTTPAGRRPFQLDSPTMAGELPQPCDLIGETEFATVFGSPSSPLLTESMASAVGVIDFGGPDATFNYIEASCRRGTTDAGRSLTAQLNLEAQLQTYETAHGARTDFATRQNDATAVPDQISDQIQFGVFGGSRVLSVRVGRVIAHLSYRDPDELEPSAEKQIRLLLPVARVVAQRLDQFR